MINCQKRLAVATDCRIGRGSGVEQIRTFDFPEIGKRLLKTKVRRSKHGLIKIIRDSFSGNRICQSNFDRLHVVDEALASSIAEWSCAAFLLNLSERQIRDRSRTLQSHVGLVDAVNLLPLSFDLVVLTSKSHETWQKEVPNLA